MKEVVGLIPGFFLENIYKANSMQRHCSSVGRAVECQSNVPIWCFSNAYPTDVGSNPERDHLFSYYAPTLELGKHPSSAICYSRHKHAVWEVAKEKNEGF